MELFNTPLYADANLVAYYRLENTTDSSSGGHNLTNNNSVAFNPARFNNGADGGSSNANKSLSIANNLGIVGGACSLTFWVKINTEPGSGKRYGLVEVSDSGTNTTQLIFYDQNPGTNIIHFERVRQAIAEDQASYSINLGTLNFYHLVYTYDGTNIKGYFNGASVASATSTGNGSGGGFTGFSILAEANASNYASAIVDDAAVFSRALSATEVSNLYTGNFPQSMPNYSVINQPYPYQKESRHLDPNLSFTPFVSAPPPTPTPQIIYGGSQPSTHIQSFTEVIGY